MLITATFIMLWNTVCPIGLFFVLRVDYYFPLKGKSRSVSRNMISSHGTTLKGLFTDEGFITVAPPSNVGNMLLYNSKRGVFR